MKTEIRSYAGSASPKLTGRTVSGYAIVFNSKSEIMYSPEERKQFVELIKPEAVTRDLIMKSDIKMLLEHSRERLLARCNKGKGTLDIWIDGKGVGYRFESPKTADGNFAVEMIKRGDITGSSFAFEIEDEKWEKNGGLWLRTITKINRLHDFSITTDPAYSQTTTSVRMQERYKRLGIRKSPMTLTEITHKLKHL